MTVEKRQTNAWLTDDQGPIRIPLFRAGHQRLLGFLVLAGPSQDLIAPDIPTVARNTRHGHYFALVGDDLTDKRVVDRGGVPPDFFRCMKAKL